MEEYYNELLSNARNPFLERLAKEQGIDVSADFSQDAVGARERMIEDLANRWPTDIDGARKLLTIFLTTLCAPAVPEGAEEKTTRAPSSPTSASRMLLHPAVIVPGLMPDTFRISDIATVTDNILAVWQKQLEDRKVVKNDTEILRQEFEAKEMLINQRFACLLADLDKQKQDLQAEHRKMIDQLRLEYDRAPQSPTDASDPATPHTSQPTTPNDNTSNNADQENVHPNPVSKLTKAQSEDKCKMSEEVHNNNNPGKKKGKRKKRRIQCPYALIKEEKSEEKESGGESSLPPSPNRNMEIKSLLSPPSQGDEDTIPTFPFPVAQEKSEGCIQRPTIPHLKRKREKEASGCVKILQATEQMCSKKRKQLCDDVTRSSYVFFSAEYFPLIASRYPEFDFDTQVVLVAQKWKKLSGTEKHKYECMAQKEKERWEREAASTEEKLNAAFRSFRLRRFSAMAARCPDVPSDRILDLLRQEWDSMNVFQKVQFLMPSETDGHGTSPRRECALREEETAHIGAKPMMVPAST